MIIINYVNKVKYIFLEEGFINLIRRFTRYLAYLVKRQIYKSEKDHKRWELIKHTIKGNRVFLIGNGPSLNITPLHLLKNETTVCVNRFNLMFDRLSWRPNMFTISDDVVLLDMIDEIEKIADEIEYLFLPDIHPSSPISVNYKKLIKNYENIYWFHLDKIGFSNELPSIGLNKTVTNVAIQILVYLGFDEIYLVGVDLDYKKHNKVKNLDNRHVESTVDNDPNHFDPRYFGSGRKYHIPRMDETFKKFNEAKNFCDSKGVKVYNATIGGKLEVFPRVDFRSLFNYNQKNELDLILNTIGLKNNGYEQFSDAFPTAKKIISEEQWDERLDAIISPAEFGYKLIPKIILTHLPLGPFNNEYLFIKRG